MKKISSLLITLLFTIPSFSQEVEMADTFRANGKIYVVVSILTLILVGLLGYLISIDRKATRLEKKLEEK